MAIELEENLQPIKNLESCIEAVVFAAGYPMPYQKLAEVTGLTAREVKRLAERIAKRYEDEDVVKFINGILGSFVRAEFPEEN